MYMKLVRVLNFDMLLTACIDKNLSGDEIANVNLFTTISHTYFKIPKERTYFV